jgi:multimeric flavodoxin WrbA
VVIALINGSPKGRGSASNCILQELKPLLAQDGNRVLEYHFRNPALSPTEMEEIRDCDVLIFAFPLYVDGIPSHLLSCLVQLERYLAAIPKKEIMVYSIVNCGFYEGEHNELAVEMLKNWCIKAGLTWGQGIGIGAGGMLPMLQNVPIGHGPKKNLGKGLAQLAHNVLERTSGESLFFTANLPRIVYKLAAEIGWRRSIKANGLKRQDLSLRK